MADQAGVPDVAHEQMDQMRHPGHPGDVPEIQALAAVQLEAEGGVSGCAAGHGIGEATVRTVQGGFDEQVASAWCER